MWLRSAEVGWGPFLSNTTIKLTSIISVWASLLQDVDGGDIVLISTNALGNCPSSGLSRLWQAEKWNKQLRAYCPPLRMKNAWKKTWLKIYWAQNLLSTISTLHSWYDSLCHFPKVVLYTDRMRFTLCTCHKVSPCKKITSRTQTKLH